MNSSNVFKSHPLHASHGIIHILFINNEKQTIIIIKVMAQSYANISNDVLLDLEKKTESICKGSSSYYSSIFKKMSFKNLQNAKILYEFLITEQNYQNIKLSTKITHIKAICLFRAYPKIILL
ncbi:MAG TPA: hypothetical protein VFP49_12635 [Nitrososphaeraceae archaeon]|nr:hypothetical protein [Nitrososphaeraceae archaeon]